MIASRSVYGKAPKRQLHSTPIAVPGSGHTGKLMNSLKLSSMIHVQVKSASQGVLCRMQLTLHATRRTPHGASHLVQAMSTWRVKTRRAPSRHCRDAMVYGRTTSAMHDNEYPPPPPPCCSVSKWMPGQWSNY